MIRILTAVLTLALLLGAGAARAACPVSPGPWGGGFFMQVETSNQIQTDMKLGTATRTTAVMSLEIGADCSVTGVFDAAVNQVAVVMTGQVPFQGLCNIPLRYSLIKGEVVTGSDGALVLVLDVGVKFDSEKATCFGDMQDMREAILSEAKKYGGAAPERRRYRLFVDYDDGYEMSGERSLEDPAVIRQVKDLKENAIPYAETYRWMLFRGGIPQVPPAPPPEEDKGEPPFIDGVEARLGDYFLAGIHLVVNDYTATVDWAGEDPGSVTFTLGAEQTYGQGGPQQYVAPVQISHLEAGGHLLTVVATNAKGAQHEVIKAIPMYGVPAWAEPYGLMASDQGEWVLYSGKGQLPAEPLRFGVRIPDQVPYLGGLWGLSPTLFGLELNATSAGGLSNGVLSVSGSLGVAGKESALVLREDSYARTRMTGEAGLTFDDGLIKLEAAPLSFTKRLALLDVIPGADAIYDLPVVGGALRQFQPALFEATIAATLGGELPLGIVADRIDLTGGSVLSGVTLTAAAGPSVGVAFLQLIGEASGTMTVQIAPAVAITDCSLLASFYVRYGAFGYGGTFPNPPRQIALTSCGQFAALPEGTRLARGPLGLAAPLPEVALLPADAAQPEPPRLLPRPADWRPEQAPAAPLAPEPDGATTLVADVNGALAAPALASDGRGRLALAWIAEDPALERPAAWQVRVRLFNGSDWGEAFALGPAAGPHYAPAIAFDGGGNLVVAWVQGPAKAGATLDAGLLDAMEIATAFVAANGAGIALHPVTGDSRPDSNPQLATGRDGHVWLAWQSHAPGQLAIDQTRPGRLLAAPWLGAGWGAIETVSQALTGGVSWDLAVLDGERAILGAHLGGGVALAERRGGAWQAMALGEAPADAAIAAAFGPRDQALIAWSVLGGVAGPDGTLLPATAGGIVTGHDAASGETRPWAYADGRLAGLAATDQGWSLLLRGAEDLRVLARPAEGAGSFAAEPAAEAAVGPLGFGALAAVSQRDGAWSVVWTAPPADAPSSAQADLKLLTLTPEARSP